jgi:hypothetical protein
MTDDVRHDVNRRHLAQCHPAFRQRLSTVIARLQLLGERPRIQQAWRSPEEQRQAFVTGHSRLRWGFHNATALDGTPEALAADVLDDDHPLNPSRAYLFVLARESRAVGLTTGIDWGLPTAIRSALALALAHETTWEGKIGWDACHVEVTGITVAQARAGIRPPDPLPEGTLRV